MHDVNIGKINEAINMAMELRSDKIYWVILYSANPGISALKSDTYSPSKVFIFV